MTKEEILAMGPGEELDALVGKEIMEWTPEEIEVNMLNSPHHFSWSPSTDISDAYSEVLEKLKEKWDCIELTWDVGAWDIHLENYSAGKELYLGREAGETYEKLPEAICKAALLAKLERR